VMHTVLARMLPSVGCLVFTLPTLSFPDQSCCGRRVRVANCNPC
jgi:hypothetical protein